MRIDSGKLFAFFSFDVGYEIDLDRLRRELPEGVRAGMGGRKLAPAYMQYASPPLVLPGGDTRLMLIERPTRATATLRVHDFGAVTVAFEMPFDGEEGAQLPTLTAALTAGGAMETAARTVLRENFPRIAPAVARPFLEGHGLVEDYYVFQVSGFVPPADAATLLSDHRDLVARTLHCEPAPLSRTESDEVLKTAVSYTPDDLVVTDWNVALVYDDDYEDTLNVLELLNVQLLEVRFLDTMLDSRINALYEHLARPRRWFSFRPSIVRVTELSELRLDIATLRERMINAIKLIGDLYLAKIYARTAERLQLAAWQRSIDGKLDVLENISDVFTNRADTARAELLEVTIIILIAVEIALLFIV